MEGIAGERQGGGFDRQPWPWEGFGLPEDAQLKAQTLSRSEEWGRGVSQGRAVQGTYL